MNAIINHNEFILRADLGMDCWWQEIAQQGNPHIQPLPNGECQLTFFWRQALDTNIKAVYIDVYSHTPHPAKNPTRFSKIPATDIWLWQTILPDNWLGSYVLVPVTEKDLAPLDPQDRRAWWVQMLNYNAVADPLNLLPVQNNATGVPLSQLRLPGARLHPAWKQVQGCPSLVSEFEIKKIIWRSERLNNSRHVWSFSTAADKNAGVPLVIILDGNYWVKDKFVTEAIAWLTQSNQLQPALYVLVDAINQHVRSEELCCNENFWLAIQNELLPKLAENHAVTDEPDKTLLVGQSYGGLAAVYAGLRFPQRFGLAISQSGSFWWPCMEAYGTTPPMGADGQLIEALKQAKYPRSRVKVFMEIGQYENAMQRSNRELAKLLLNRGHSVSFREFPGGHDRLCWGQGLLDGISYFFSIKNRNK